VHQSDTSIKCRLLCVKNNLTGVHLWWCLTGLQGTIVTVPRRLLRLLLLPLHLLGLRLAPIAAKSHLVPAVLPFGTLNHDLHTAQTTDMRCCTAQSTVALHADNGMALPWEVNFHIAHS
jgi:hypothetical protein